MSQDIDAWFIFVLTLCICRYLHCLSFCGFFVLYFITSDLICIHVSALITKLLFKKNIPGVPGCHSSSQFSKLERSFPGISDKVACRKKTVRNFFTVAFTACGICRTKSIVFRDVTLQMLRDPHNNCVLRRSGARRD